MKTILIFMFLLFTNVAMGFDPIENGAWTAREKQDLRALKPVVSLLFLQGRIPLLEEGCGDIPLNILVDMINTKDKKKTPYVLILDSPGGSVACAEEIVKVLSTEEFGTLVLGDSECFSACFQIFVSAKKHLRLYRKGAKIGSHLQRYADTGSVAYKSSIEDLGLLGKKRGIPSDLILKFLSTSPDDMYTLTSKELTSIAAEI